MTVVADPGNLPAAPKAADDNDGTDPPVSGVKLEIHEGLRKVHGLATTSERVVDQANQLAEQVLIAAGRLARFGKDQSPAGRANVLGHEPGRVEEALSPVVAPVTVTES